MERYRPAEPPLSLAQAAMQYARMGWPVFPLAGKYPYKGSHGHLDATVDLQEIEHMWQDHPHANIGLTTGAVAGVIVLDIDPGHNGHVSSKELERRYGDLPDTRTARTAHGGLHRYYQHPRDGNRYPNVVQLNGLAGVDVRGDGGYVVLPPSRLYNTLSYHWGNPEKPIAEAPAWLLALLLGGREQEGTSQAGRFAYHPGSKWLTQAIQEAREGNRNAVGFHLACQLRDDGLSEAEAVEIMLAYAHRVPQGKTPIP